MMIQQLGKHRWEIRATPGDGQQQDKPAQLDTSRGTVSLQITIRQRIHAENYKDLAMIENQEENTEAQNTKLSNYRVWIGLYREPWTWSDGSKSSFRNWLPNTGLNNINENQHCITENPQHQWNTLKTPLSSELVFGMNDCSQSLCLRSKGLFSSLIIF
uniref:C-type lectin domain-containing protein n=1 Tax=Oryzias latipes TaxID=8090 RepID=A0A3B3ILD4_ORYLA